MNFQFWGVFLEKSVMITGIAAFWSRLVANCGKIVTRQQS